MKALGLARVAGGFALAQALVYSLGALGQSVNPLPGASFGDDYAPRPAFPEQTRAPPPATPSAVNVEVVSTGLEHPWSLAFLPDGSMLVAERAGRLLRVTRDGRRSEPISGLPAVKAIGTKGLHDVAVHPDFRRNRLVYLSYFAPNPLRPATEPASAYEAWLRLPAPERELKANKIGFESIGRGRLSNDMTRLEDFQVVFSAPSMGARRLVFARDGALLVTADTPGSGDSPTGDEPQRLDNLYGKVLRLSATGSAPPDNPLRTVPRARPEIYAYGFRDPEGAAIDPRTGDLWVTDHGPRGGDELNLVRAGRNYGFPLISYGLDYRGRLLGSGKLQAPGLEQPVYFWTPSIAPSGLAIYDGALFPNWRGDVFVGALTGRKLVRLVMRNGKVSREEALLTERKKRVRDVREGPDGALYVLTDEDSGELLRLTPGRN